MESVYERGKVWTGSGQPWPGAKQIKAVGGQSPGPRAGVRGMERWLGGRRALVLDAVAL